MSQPTVHIINHTHWDREWFLSSIYTTHWIPTLIDRVLEISAENPDFRYLLDGQTLIIEDLLKAYPDYEPKVAKLIRDGNLTIGPYYCQPDWKLTYGESLFRNLEYGRKDMEKFGRTTNIGWLVDTFGHISQGPQIHDQFGIDAVYVWRGMPMLEPYFTWQGPDGTQAFGVDLFGGYRNLYGVTHAPEVAQIRLDSEIAKLSPYYPTPDIPLFDGYDLEDNPEDPVTFLNSERVTGNKKQVTLLEATPRSFVDAVRPKLNGIPTIIGELNSGKYGATFPGIYSSRSYAKIMNRDCANALYRWVEPLAAMAWLKGRPYDTDKYEEWGRLLLQNDVHDVTCGVSIDQVHEKAEDIYKQVWAGLSANLENSLASILHDFAPGIYTINLDPLNGSIGVQPASNSPTSESAGDVAVGADGVLQIGGATIGRLAVYVDRGDTYSDETGDFIGVLAPVTSPTCENMPNGTTHVCYRSEFVQDGITISADVQIIVAANSLVRFEINLNSTGSEFRVEMLFETGLAGSVFAGMPFDVVKRPYADYDLLPREVGDRAKIFMGQRELNEVRSFPFHDFVAIDDGGRSAVVFAKGLNSYRAYEDGKLSVTLRRSGEWVTRGNLKNRIGDAGPFFYVPDARCERKVTFELAFGIGEFSAESLHVQKLNAAYQNPPLIVEWNGDGDQTEWQFLQREVPLSSLRVVDDQIVARWYNPTNETVGGIAPKQIVAEAIEAKHKSSVVHRPSSDLTILNYPKWRVGDNQGLPDEAEIGRLRDKIAVSRAAKEEAEGRLTTATGNDRHLVQHQVYIHHREMLEYTLSARLNEVKLACNGNIDHAYLYEPDPEVVKIGWELNQLRIKRRIYDYVAAALR